MKTNRPALLLSAALCPKKDGPWLSRLQARETNNKKKLPQISPLLLRLISRLFVTFNRAGDQNSQPRLKGQLPAQQLRREIKM